MKKSPLQTAKNIFGQLHLWLGLASGLIVFVICLTGTILAFEKDIENFLNREVVYVKPQEKKVNVDEILASYHSQFDVPVSRISVYKNPKRAVLVSGSDRETGERVNAYFNPYTGELNGLQNEAPGAFFSQTMRLHRWLLVRRPGRLIVGIATTIFLFMLLSGLVLWWPRKLSKIKNGLRIRWKAPWKVVNYQLHNVLGFYSLILLFVMAFSGLYIGQKWFRNGVNSFLATSDQQQKNQPANQPEAQKTAIIEKPDEKEPTTPEPLSYQNLIDKANAALPYASDVIISFPRKPEDDGRITKYNRQYGSRLSETAYFDNQTGEITEVSTFAERDAVQKFRYINRFIHTGELMGWPLQLLYLLACLVGTSLPITGTIIWWKKRRK